MCCNKCICCQISLALSGLTNWMKNNPIIIAFVFGFFGVFFLISGFFSWENAEILFIASGSVFTASTIMYMASCYQNDAKEKKSEFYLKQIQNYLKASIWITGINHNDNNISHNIRWHRAINSFKAVELLREKLTEKSHIEIYLIDYLDTAYNLIEIISSIDSYQFFFGVTDYKKNDGTFKSDYELYGECQGPGLSTRSISPQSLYFLARFIDRASRVKEDIQTNSTLIIDCIQKSYFKKIDDNYGDFSKLANIEIIREYLSAYKRCESKPLRIIP